MKIRENNKGFSTVELVVTIAVLAIITGVLSVSVIKYVEQAKRTKALTDARAIYSAAQYAVINAATEEKESFNFALKFEEVIDGNTVTLGRFSNQSLYKFLKESSGSESLSSAKSKKADYYIAKELAYSIPGADGEIADSTLKNKSPIGDSHSTKYISEHPEIYGSVVFAMAYNNRCEIVYFQCVYEGYFITLEGKELTAEKVSDDTRFNDWPRTRAEGTDGW